MAYGNESILPSLLKVKHRIAMFIKQRIGCDGVFLMRLREQNYDENFVKVNTSQFNVINRK